MPELYEFCLRENIADKNLIAKWKKQGYENLCCLRCIQTRDTNFGTNCICRVPKGKLEEMRQTEADEMVSNNVCDSVASLTGAGFHLQINGLDGKHFVRMLEKWLPLQ
uniref:Protein BUD31 homolog n=1 Tax=Timema shepardi TaxID=629360 RepID=A0A7R9B379_TIMSH|nr:unnamed protein product [Timema shepardi]